MGTLAAALIASFSIMECDPTGKLCAVDLTQGQAAPYNGQLLTPALAVTLGQKADKCDAKIDLEVATTKKLANTDLQLEKQQHTIDVDAKQQQIDNLNAALKQETAFYKQPLFVAGGTAIVMTILYIGVSSTLEAIHKR